MSDEVTLVLAHGAWADGSSWGKVIDLIADAANTNTNTGTGTDVRVVTAALPLTTLEDDVAALDRMLERVGGPVVLAGHAYAGGVIGSTKAENVRALIYVAALAPDEGQSVIDAFGRSTPHPAAPALTPDGHGYVWLPDEAFAAAFAQLASPREQNRLRALQRPIALACITQPVGRPLWKERPSWYLVAEEDRMISSENQRFMAERMGASIETHRVDHMVLLTAPEVVAELLLRVVGITGGAQA